MERLWVFEPLDTLFFRDGLPFNAGESFATVSRFPPTAFTLQGAVRTAVLSTLGIDPGQFGQAAASGHWQDARLREARKIVGDADGSSLRFTGPFLLKGEEFLYPAPLDLYRTPQGHGLLRPGEPVESDRGQVRFPTGQEEGLKVEEGKWVTSGAMAHLLAGEPEELKPEQILPCFPQEGAKSGSAALADREYRIGLGRDLARRTVQDGLLYSTAHVRLRQGVTIGMLVDGVPIEGEPVQPMLQALGGESRQARLSVRTPKRWPTMPTLRREADGWTRFKLVFTTPFRFGDWLPPRFVECEMDGVLHWQGELGGIDVQVVSACVGKTVRIGGWDMARGIPRSLQSYLPAGSVYFCRTQAEPETLAVLHGSQVGDETEFGFGHVLVGAW